ncbi:MAG: MBL fold metallo-hydrolase [Armatimonadota bacterium]
MPRIERLADDLILIDTEYNQTPQAIGVFLLLGDPPGLIETGPASTVDMLLDGVRAAGVDPRDLGAIAVTHIHLDHAGAAGTLVERFPQLHVYVHPVGAPHLVDPTRLMASAGRLYGETLDRLLGRLVAIPPDHVHALEDGGQITLGKRRLVAIGTPGHARHHLAYLDEASGDLFAGDAAGVALPGSRYVRPPTPPPELDIPAWDATIARIRSRRARRLLLTHYGAHTWVDALLTQLQERLHASERLVREALNAGDNEAAIVERLRSAAAAEVRALDGAASAARFEVIMATWQSALGLVRYVKTHPQPVERSGS